MVALDELVLVELPLLNVLEVEESLAGGGGGMPINAPHSTVGRLRFLLRGLVDANAVGLERLVTAFLMIV